MGFVGDNNFVMEVLHLDGLPYVKASAIARDLGYTADYVGQLCRANKVDAKLVGRSWYVNEHSIRSHKDSRYRSTKTKTRESLHAHIEQKVHGTENATTVSPSRNRFDTKHFYAKQAPQTLQYIEDHTELIPVLKEKHSTYVKSVEVRHADAQSLPVLKKAQPYRLEATEKPKIRFRGSLSVTEGESTETEEDVTTTKNSANTVKAEVAEHAVVKKPTESQESAKDTNVHKVAVHTTQLPVPEKQGVDREKRLPQKLRTHTSKNLRLTTLEDTKSKRLPLKNTTGSPFSPQNVRSDMGLHELTILKVESDQPQHIGISYIAAALLIALTMSLGFLVLEQSIVVTDSSSVEEHTYSANFSSALESIRGLK